MTWLLFKKLMQLPYMAKYWRIPAYETLAVINWRITKTVTAIINSFSASINISDGPFSVARLPTENFWEGVILKYSPCFSSMWCCLLVKNIMNNIVRQFNWKFSLKLLFGLGYTGRFCLNSQWKYFNKPAMFATNYYHRCYKFGIQGKILVGLILATWLRIAKFANILPHQYFTTYGISQGRPLLEGSI